MDANKETHVSTWRDCERCLLKIENENSKSLTGVWFRGVSNAKWELRTTLERRTSRPLSVAEYFQLMSRVKPEIETFTGRTWELPEWSEPENDFGILPEASGSYLHDASAAFRISIADPRLEPFAIRCRLFRVCKGAARTGRGDLRLFGNAEQHKIWKHFGAKDNQSRRLRFENS
jgi:hypothetical protein